MQKCIIVYCLLLTVFITGCHSDDLSKSNVCRSENLLVITSYTDFPDNRLTINRNGAYTWEHFNIEILTWRKLFSGNLELSGLADIEKKLEKTSSGWHWWTRRIKVKNQYGQEDDLVVYMVVRENSHYVYNFSVLDSSTMLPDVIGAVLEKCDYTKVLNMLCYKID